MIAEGTARISDIGENSQIPDHDLGPGQYFGERALMTGEPRSANVKAATHMRLMAIDREAFQSV